MRYRTFLCFLCVLCVAVVNACRQKSLEPVALVPEDMCSYCRMAISERRFAAELLDSEGQALKFDDIGCMANFIQRNKSNVRTTAYFVMDFDERTWIKAEDAYYVRSSEVATPMNNSLIAFKTELKAQQAAERYHGRIERFSEVLQ